MSEWISVKNELPKSGQWVLVYIPDKIITGHYKHNPKRDFLKIRYVFKNISLTDEKSRFHKVTHWMPLPEPPKENE